MIDSPPDNTQSLPETIEALRALVLATFAERDAVVTERDTLGDHEEVCVPRDGVGAVAIGLAGAPAIEATEACP